MSDKARTALVFGAGGIGLCFVGQLFSRAGYRVVFADVDERTLGRIRAGDGYVIEAYAPDGTVEEMRISGVDTVDASDETAVRDVLASGEVPPVIATAVGQRAFGIVLENLASWAPAERPLHSLDLVAAENLHDPRALATEILGDRAPAVHACAVGKMVPRRTSDELADESLPMRIRCEAFNTLYVDGANWQTPPPEDVNGLELVNPVEAWMDRKLYIHNLGHSACAWIAREEAPEASTIAEAIGVPGIRKRTEHVMRSAARVVAGRWNGVFSVADLDSHVTDLIGRFSNPLLRDTVERVGQDITRKLGQEERLVGCMRLAVHHEPAAVPELAELYASALRFGAAGISGNDADVRLAAAGAAGADCASISGLDPADAVDHVVLEAIIGALDDSSATPRRT